MHVYSTYKESGYKWIGQIPNDWEIYPAKYIFTENKNKNYDGSVTNSLKFRFGKIVPKANFDAESDEYVADTITSYTVVEPDTIIVNGLNLNYDFKSMRVGIVKEKGVITSAYLAVVPNKELINPCFANYLLKGYEARMAFHNMGTGLRLTLGFKEFKNQPIVLPDRKTQDFIVEFLNKQIERIDSLIEEAKESIEEYKSWKASIIYEAVIKGLDPNVEMKDSGVEWIGSIPSDWNVGNLGYFVSMIQTGPFGSQLHSDDYIEGGISVINPANIQNGTIIPNEKACITKEKADSLKQHYLQLGDIIFGRRGEMGRCACITDTSRQYFCGTGCIKIRCNNLLYPLFASYYLQMARVKQYLELHSVGTTMANLNSSIISAIPIICPPIEEQHEICSYIVRKMSTIDSLVHEKELLIADLEAYKKSLIYEVVTGKRKVV